jgi:hypothetical protein
MENLTKNITLNINSSLEEMEKYQNEIHQLLCSTNNEEIINSLYNHQGELSKNSLSSKEDKATFQITEKDKTDLFETTKELMIDYIENETLTYAKQSFHEDTFMKTC